MTTYTTALTQFAETFWSMSNFNDCWGDDLYELVIADYCQGDRQIYDKAYKDFCDSLTLYDIGKKIALVANNPDNDQPVDAYELAGSIYGPHEDHTLDDLYQGIDDHV